MHGNTRAFSCVFLTKGKFMQPIAKQLYINVLARVIDTMTLEQNKIITFNLSSTQTRLDAILLIERDKQKLERQLNRLL
jgi:hypothetical protein